MKDKIKALLGQGHSAELVSTIIGCDPSYISQLLEDELFRNEVSELRVQALQAATDRDRKWDGLEDKLLDKINTAVDFVIKPREIAQLLSLANAAKRRGATAQETITINSKVVNLLIPAKLTMNFSLNQNNQVIAVGEKSMLTLPSNKIDELAKEHNLQIPAQIGVQDEQNSMCSSDLVNRLNEPTGEVNGKEESGTSRITGKKVSAKSIKDLTAAELKELL